jgi:outer membrane protein TolC
MKQLVKVLKASGYRLQLHPMLPLGKLLGVVLFLSLLGTQPLQAQSLEDYLLEAAKNNPGLQAAYAQYQATTEQVNQVSMPNPEFQAGFFLRPMERFMGNQSTDLRLMQMFPWRGMLTSQKEEAYQMGQAAYFRFLDKKNQLFLEVKSTWLELLLSQGELKLTQQTLDYLNKQESLLLVNYQVGNSAELNSPTPSMPTPQPIRSTGSGMSGMGNAAVTESARPVMNNGMPIPSMTSASIGMQGLLQLKLRRNEQETILMQLQENLAVLKIQFNQLLNRPIDSPVALPEQLDAASMPLEKQAYLEKIKESNPMLAMYGAEKSAFSQQKKMAQLEGRPMVGAGINYMTFSPRIENGMPMGGNNMTMPMVTLNLPIYRKKIDSKIKEASLLQQAAEFEKKEAENRLAMQWAAAFRTWEESNRNLDLYRQQTALINQQLQLLESGLATGKSSLLEVLQLQQQDLEYQQKVLFATYQGHQSLLQLEALIQNSSIPSN